MKVLHVDTRPDWRGGQSQLLLLLEGLYARGHRAELAVMQGTPLAERARAAGIVVHALPARLWPLAGPRMIRRLVAASGFEIVHAHDPHGLTAAWLGRAHRAAALIAHRRIAAPLHGSPVALARYRAARRLIAISRLVAEKLVGSGMEVERVVVVYDGVRVPGAVSAGGAPGSAARLGRCGRRNSDGIRGASSPGKKSRGAAARSAGDAGTASRLPADSCGRWTAAEGSRRIVARAQHREPRNFRGICGRRGASLSGAGSVPLPGA